MKGTSIAWAIALACAGCHTVPPTSPDVEAARATIERAQGDAQAARAGAVELERARQALRRAESVWADDRDEVQTRHFAYLASQRAGMAVAMGEQAAADERLQRAGVERERVRLEARTRQAEAAQAAASSALNQADQARQQAARQTDRANALLHDLQALQGRATPQGMVVTLPDMLFESGRAALNGGARRGIARLVAVMQQHPERRVRVEGFTDSVGSEEFNLDLSRRRAEAVRAALVDAGIETARIEVQARGEAEPVADNATASGRQQNRRVEVLFSDERGRFA